MKDICAIVLAAGRGTRMRSKDPKALQLLCGEPLILHVIKNLKKSKAVKRIVLVLGYQADKIKACVCKQYPEVEFTLQKDISGTASAVKVGLCKVKERRVLITCTDVPLLTAKTINGFIRSARVKRAVASVITADCDMPNTLGLIKRAPDGTVLSIQERSEIAGQAIKTKEINSGIYLFDTELLALNIKKIRNTNKKKEYYLTDIIAILSKAGITVFPYKLREYSQIIGINTRHDLMQAEEIARTRVLDALFVKGVTVIDPKNTYIADSVRVGRGTVIYPFTFIEKDVIIGGNCVLGPFLRLREGTRIGRNVQLGNFLEVNRCNIADNVKAKHLGYLGDTKIENNANIGAGAVIANYDGKVKHNTRIGNSAFIGSNSVLIAPVSIGKKAVVGAGSVVTKNVKIKEVVIGVPAKPIKKNAKQKDKE